MSDTDYKCGSRDYLKRAQQLLKTGNLDALFYAAFELRCGVEARMREYLEVAEDISEKRKQGWEIVKLGKDIEQAFKLGDKVVQLTFENAAGKKARIYHTPVRQRLRKLVDQLGDYRHAMKVYRKHDDPWWKKFKLLLDECCEELAFATRGTLLGPPLWRADRRTTRTHHELGIDLSADAMMTSIGQVGENVKMGVNYLDSLPTDNK